MNCNIGYGLVSVDTAVDETVTVIRAAGAVNARLTELPFLK
jgi:hypothetical protein